MALRNQTKLGLKLGLAKTLLLVTIFSGLVATSIFVYFNLANSPDSKAATHSTGTLNCVGPGGVGDGSTNRFCFTFDSTGLNHNDAVSTAENEGGNGTAFTQSSSSNRPKIQITSNTMNGRPVLRFDGNNDVLEMSDQKDLNKSPSTQRTFNIVVRTGSNISDRQVIYEEGGATRGINLYIYNGKLYLGMWNRNNDGNDSPWDFSSVDTSISTNEEYIITMVYDGSDDNTTSGTFMGYLNGAHFGTATGIGKLYSHGDNIGLGAMNQNSYFETGRGSGDDFYFGGDIAAFIMYNYALDTAERTILENHMSSRFNIGIQNDFFSHDSSGYHHHVAGIGRTSGDLNNCAASSGLLEVYNPSDLDVGEYLLFGHNNDTGGTVSQVPSGINSRWSRFIQFDETGGVGTVDLTINLNQLNFNITEPDAMRLLVDEDGDGDFTDATVISGTYNSLSETLTFEGITLADDYLITLGSTSSANALPVEFARVSATWDDGNGLISWSTAMEENNSHFIVERRLNDETWEDIGRVEGAGNSSILLNYQFTDLQPNPKVNFYRVKQVDYDGQFDYSETVVLYANNGSITETKLNLFPNPARENLTIAWEDQRSGLVQLLNSAGTVMQESKVVNQNHLVLNVSSLPNGLYIVSFKSKRGEVRSKLLVEH